jgi:hypothetical protein
MSDPDAEYSIEVYAPRYHAALTRSDGYLLETTEFLADSLAEGGQVPNWSRAEVVDCRPHEAEFYSHVRAALGALETGA